MNCEEVKVVLESTLPYLNRLPMYVDITFPGAQEQKRVMDDVLALIEELGDDEAQTA